MALHKCKVEGCGREFSELALLGDHADAVHTFDDIQRAINDAVREKYRVEGDPRVGIKSVWAWVVDVAEDWVVFELENGSDVSLQKAGYTFNDGKVTLGDPVEVVRRTVYEPVNKES